MKEIEKQHKKNRYEKLKKLGEGAYGSVTKVYDHEEKCFKALKKIRFTNEDEGIPVHAIREVALLKKLSHQNIVKLHDVHYSWDHCKLFMALEFVEENLYEHMNRNNPLSPHAVKSYACQIMRGIEYLHQQGIMHRDLKPQNILVTETGTLKFCDFGQAKYTSLENQNHSSEVSTLWYRAPQILLGASKYHFQVDIWAAGCLIGQLVQGYPLFKANSEIGQVFQILKQRGTPTQEDFPDWKLLSPKFPKFKPKIMTIVSDEETLLSDLLEKMLQLDPEKRVGAAKALKHPYFDDYV